MILSALCVLIGFILGFLTGVSFANEGSERSAKRGYISIGDTTYKLVPMDKDAERNDS